MLMFQVLVCLGLFFVVQGTSKCPGSSLSTCLAKTGVTRCKAMVKWIIEHNRYNNKIPYKYCENQALKRRKICLEKCPQPNCIPCMGKMDSALQECQRFYNGLPSLECNQLQQQYVKHCTDRKLCLVCQDSFCQNGGVCKGGPNKLSCKCRGGFGGIYCQKNVTGYKWAANRLGTKKKPAPNAKAILEAGDSVGSGLYWIQPPGENKSAQTYCDMEYSDGGWMLASYGYVGSISSSPTNKAIPNMNNPNGYAWRPDNRVERNGVINLSQGAVMMARNATFMIMAAGNTNTSRGINQYSHVYRIDLRQNTQQITFANHNRYNGAVGGNGIPKMHLTKFLVEGLKGDVGEYVRYAFGESLGVTSDNSCPSGYGFYGSNKPYSWFNQGPFFPSVHSCDGHTGCASEPCEAFIPDVGAGSESFLNGGWYKAYGSDMTGQTSIWFK